MYPNDQSISSYSSNPSTPVNSPPPLTQTPGTALSIHNSTPSTSWQQLTPANVVLNNAPAPILNGIQNGQYGPELVHRGLHMVISSTSQILNNFLCVVFSDFGVAFLSFLSLSCNL
jgi:hypothetical protein